MEQFRPRLLRTYAGLRGRQTGPAAAAPLGGLRRLPAWISPQLDPKRIFSTSSSSSFSSPASPDDPEYKPSKKKPSRAPPRRRAPRKQKGSSRRKEKNRGSQKRQAKAEEKENQQPPTHEPLPVKGGSVPSTPLRRNVTCRQRRGPRLQPPLFCSTPEPTPTPTPALESEKAEEPGAAPQYSLRWLRCGPEEVFREGSKGGSCSHGSSVLDLLRMDEDAEELGGSLKLFSDSSTELWQKALHNDFQARSAVSRLRFSGSPCVAGRSSQPRHPWSQIGASSGDREGRVPSTGPVASSCLLQSPETDLCRGQPGSPKINSVPSRRSQGVCQLQATVQDGKVLLFDTPLHPQKAAGELKRALVKGGSHCIIDQNSPRLQPFVLLDDQVVQKWLASSSTRKQATVPPSQVKKPARSSASPCPLPEVSDSSRGCQAVPASKAGESSRRACIAGFSSSRWRQHGKQTRARKSKKWKQADSFLCHGALKRKENEEALASPLLSPDSLFKNCSLWCRIRASFSLHRKKIILSEAETFNSSTDSVISVRSHFKEVLQTPFTQKLGYSICPSSSMVRLSSMTCFSTPEVTLSDADKVYGECQQKGPISFEDCISPEKMQQCEKVGEGVFGEVFRTESERGTIALKIIPIEGKEHVNGEPQKSFSEILPEIIISKELSLLASEEVNQTSGFISLYSVHCVQGSYPDRLLNAWDQYHRLKKSENDRPDFFEGQQLFMVLEFEFGGTDLENMRNQKLNSVAASRSILHQITASLAVAEEALHFEHRDLHWGNILVKKTDLKEVSFTLKGETHVLPTQGILVNIIDYTFSRLEKDGLTVYCDLSADEEVFQGNGDYQFDIYRQMREENANKWADYFPHSNVLWLHYLADKLLKEVSYKKKSTASSMKQTLKQLKLFSEEILSYRSATEALNSSSFFQ